MAEKPSFDKMINSSQNIIPKRLSFDFLNNSGGGNESKKRKMEDMSVYEVPVDQSTISKTFNETLNSSTGSTSSIVPWEVKLLRIDLTEAQTRITQLKKEIQHQTTIQQELELKFASKEKTLESEVNQYKNKAQELEKILKKNRKNEQTLKEELIKANNKLNLQKQSFDQTLFKLQNENKTLKETLNYETNSLQNVIAELQRDINEVGSMCETTEKENKSLRKLNEELTEKIKEMKNIQNELDQEKMKYQEASLKIKDLEFQVNSYGDWKEVEKVSTSRMSGMSEIEKEVTRLRQANKSLHDSIGNKLLLEEQVHSLKTRLEHFEKANEDQIALKTKIKALENELDDWKKIGVDFVHKGSAPNPINVRSYVEKLLHRDLQLASEKSSASTEKSTIENELGDLKIKNEALIKQTEALEKSLKTHQAIVLKLQKKMRLVQMERDSQRQLLDSYERDLTVTQGNAPPSSSAVETQNRLRIEMLTNSVAGYKELCGKLEAEITELRGNPGLAASDPTFCSSEQYKTLRKDLEALRIENDKLRKRKNELEIEIENLTLRNNCIDDNRLKVVHFKNNPATIAQQAAAEELVKLKAEIERLKIRNRKLEEGNDDLTTRLNETMNMTMNIKDLQKIKEEYAQLQAKYNDNENLFKRINQELREVVYMLFGYKLDRYGNKNYRITSMYADHETDELIFHINEEGALDMLETEYSKMLSAFMSQYLQGPNSSLPAFTSALTLELVNRLTVTTVS